MSIVLKGAYGKIWGLGQVSVHAILHAAKSITAEMHAAIPARDDNEMITQLGPFQHTQYDRACTAFTIVVLDGSGFVTQERPCVVGRFRETLVTFEGLKEG